MKKWKKKPNIYDGDEKFRFALGVSGEKMLVVIALNPSTANEKLADVTMQKIEKICENNNYDGFLMLNLCALRASKSSQLPLDIDQKIFKDNIDKIGKYLQEYQRSDILLAYGNNIANALYLKESLRCLFSVLKDRNLLVLRKTQDGHPTHPGAYPREKNGPKLEEEKLKAFKEEFKQDFQDYLKTI